MLAVFLFVLTLSLLSGGKVHAASITVATDTNPSPCTLDEAIQNVNAGVQTNSDCVETGSYGTNDTIAIPEGTVTLSGNLPYITRAVNINGAGMGKTTIDGDGQWRTINNSSATLEMSGITITGFARGGIISDNSSITLDQVEIDGTGSVFQTGVNTSAYGIAINNGNPGDITVNISNVYIHDITTNGTQNTMPLLVSDGDSGDSDSGSVVAYISNTTIANITGSQTVTGIITSAGMYSLGFGTGTVQAAIDNMTIANIHSTGSEAGAFVVGAATMQDHTVSTTVNNITITDVSGIPGPLLGGSTGVAFAIFSGGFVDGIHNTLSLKVANSAVVNSGAGCVKSDISTITFGSNSTSTLDLMSDGGNVLDTTCSDFTQPTDQNNITNLASTLGPLSDNGGYVPTMALLQGSPAIDSGVTVAGLTTDARQAVRPQGTAYDSGAYESPFSKATTAPASLASTGQNTTVFTTIAISMLTIMTGVLVFRRQHFS